MLKQNRKIIVIVFLLVVTGTFFLTNVSQAALVNCGRTDPATRQISECQLIDLLRILISIINILLGLSWLAATFYLFWASWSMVMAFGNPEGLAGAKTSFRHAIFGFFFIMIAFLLINFAVFAFSGYNIRGQGEEGSIFNFFPAL